MSVCCSVVLCSSFLLYPAGTELPNARLQATFCLGCFCVRVSGMGAKPHTHNPAANPPKRSCVWFSTQWGGLQLLMVWRLAPMQAGWRDCKGGNCPPGQARRSSLHILRSCYSIPPHMHTL